VGRHILIGALAGMGATLLFAVPDLARAFGVAPPRPNAGNLDAVASFPLRIEQIFAMVQQSFFIPVSFLLAVLVFRVMFRRPWLAYGALMVLAVTATTLAQGANQGFSVSVFVLGGMLTVFVMLVLLVLTRFGLFAMLVMINFSYWNSVVLTTSPSSWMFPGSVLMIAMFAIIATYGAWISLGDQKVFTDAI